MHCVFVVVSPETSPHNTINSSVVELVRFLCSIIANKVWFVRLMVGDHIVELDMQTTMMKLFNLLLVNL